MKKSIKLILIIFILLVGNFSMQQNDTISLDAATVMSIKEEDKPTNGGMILQTIIFPILVSISLFMLYLKIKAEKLEKDKTKNKE